MIDTVDGIKFSYKLNMFLSKKLNYSQKIVNKLKRKRLIYNVLFTLTAGSSITIQ